MKESWLVQMHKDCQLAVYFYATNYPRFSQREVSKMFGVSTSSFYNSWRCYKANNGIKDVNRY